jgi:hypothetical protein
VTDKPTDRDEAQGTDAELEAEETRAIILARRARFVAVALAAAGLAGAACGGQTDTGSDDDKPTTGGESGSAGYENTAGVAGDGAGGTAGYGDAGYGGVCLTIAMGGYGDVCLQPAMGGAAGYGDVCLQPPIGDGGSGYGGDDQGGDGGIAVCLTPRVTKAVSGVAGIANTPLDSGSTSDDEE